MNDADVPDLPEYAGNPFIAKLPPLRPQKALFQALRKSPLFEEKERSYPAFVRKHCIARLSKCFLPQARQVDLAERFDLLLRQGYLGRNPLTHDYLDHLRNGIERIEARSLDAMVASPVQNTASSFALLGCPGVGKTLATNCVLAQYPQVIDHDQPFRLKQIVWLRLEAPALGSLKQLCIDFFDAIDRLIGSDYVKRYATQVSVEQMLPHMVHVAHLHALGVLVIDEIQHLKGVKVGPEALMKFLVKLVNTIGVPVVTIGTMGALSIVQRSFSHARRSTGLGSLIWERMEPGATWDSFLKKLWKYQWTDVPTDLTPELSAVLYDQSQGVADLAVKLYMLAQLRVVGIGELRSRQTEALTKALFEQVAREEFALVRPMIEALRENDPIKCSKYDDLRSLNDHIGLVLTRALSGGETLESVPDEVEQRGATTVDEPIEQRLEMMLVQAGVARDVAKVVIGEAIASTASKDPLVLLQKVAATLTASPPMTKKPRATPPSGDVMPEDDLRRIVGEGKKTGVSAYDALLAAGSIHPPMLEFAA
jgi:hypothetical protein